MMMETAAVSDSNEQGSILCLDNLQVRRLHTQSAMDGQAVLLYIAAVGSSDASCGSLCLSQLIW